MALAMAGLVSLLVYRLLRSGGGSAKAAVTVPVVVAALPLKPGVPLQETDLKVMRFPPDALPAHVFHAVAKLDGEVLTTPAVPNQMIVGEMVATPGSGVGLPPLIPPGMRAVSVKVNDVVSVAGFAVPGTHVDVLLTGNPSSNGNPREVTTITLLSNVQVLTAGQQMEKSPNGKPEQVTVITLLVDPAGAEKLALADGYGHIQLALRNPLDRLPQKTEPVLNASLYERPHPMYRRRRVVKKDPAPPPAWGVDLIVGDKNVKLKFPAAREEMKP